MSPEAREHSFDELARGLASGSISRGKALRLMGGLLVGGTLGSLGMGGIAAADEECKPLTRKCKKDNQCCSGNCSKSGTSRFGTCACQENGGSCANNSQCCSENCANGTCAAACTSNGGSCTSGSQCCSGNCPSGTCCGSNGASCTLNAQCCSGICFNNTCVAATSSVACNCENGIGGLTACEAIDCNSPTVDAMTRCEDFCAQFGDVGVRTAECRCCCD